MSKLFRYSKFLCSDKNNSNLLKSKLTVQSKLERLMNTELEEKTVDSDSFVNNIIHSVEEKNRREAVLKKEITLNPLFNEVFPHLKDSGLLHKTNELKVKEAQNRNKDFFSSLLNKHRFGYDLRTKLEKEEDNYSKFIDSYSKTGPKHNLTAEEKDKIHKEIDDKMEELENSGLSRYEILNNEPKGLPLKQDQFFQFLKRNRVGREMLLESTEELSVENVINKALKQNIGPDPSVAAGKVKYLHDNEIPDNYAFELQNKLFDKNYKNLQITDDAYYYKSNYNNKIKLHLNYLETKPVSLIQRPMSRSEKRKKFMIRNISINDLHWKNLPLMSKFINDVGGILSRYQSRLPFQLHKRATKVIKHLRCLGLFPAHDKCRPTDKIPFKSIHSEFIEDMTKKVDPISGKIITRPMDFSLNDKAGYGSRYDSAKQSYEASKNE